MLHTSMRRTLSGLFGLAISLMLVSGWVFVSASTVNASGFTFKTYELSSVTGVVCPNKSGTCTNSAAEPAIRADKAGHFYASSENGLGAGTLAWKGTGNGLHYTALVSPDSVSHGSPFAPGGGDTDLAVAPVKNASGIYNVYVASLSGANVDISTSMDGGKTFSLNPIGATISGDDREWIAADSSSKVCISYHDIATDNIIVNCSADAGKTFTQVGLSFDTNHLFLTD